MRPWFALLSLASGLIVAGCGGDETPPADVRDEMPFRDPLRPGVRLDRLLAASGDAQPVLDAMRPPRTREAVPVANAHVEGQVDSVVTWTYDGLAVEAHAVTGGPTLVRRVVATESAYGTLNGVSVGETRANLEDILGEASAEAGGVASYLADAAEMPTFVDVVYAPDDDGVDRAVRIAWRLPVD